MNAPAGKPILGENGGEVAVSKNERMVILAVRENVTGRFASVKINPEVALALGEQLAKDAYTVLYGTAPPTLALKDAAIERKRQTLIARLPILLRQMLERKRPPEYIAQELIDRVLQEVLQ